MSDLRHDKQELEAAISDLKRDKTEAAAAHQSVIFCLRMDDSLTRTRMRTHTPSTLTSFRCYARAHARTFKMT